MHRILERARAAQAAQAAAAQQQQQEAAARAAEERARQEAARVAAETAQRRAEQERAAREQQERDAQARREAEQRAQQAAAERQAQQQRQQQQAEETRRVQQQAAARAAEERARQEVERRAAEAAQEQAEQLRAARIQQEQAARPAPVVNNADPLVRFVPERNLAERVVAPVLPAMVDAAAVQQRAQTYANDLGLPLEDAIAMARADLEDEARIANVNQNQLQEELDFEGLEEWDRDLEEIRLRNLQVPAPQVAPNAPIAINEAAVQQRAQTYANDLGLPLEAAIAMARADLEDEARIPVAPTQVEANAPIIADEAAVRQLAEMYTNDFYGYDMETAMRVARIDLESEARVSVVRMHADANAPTIVNEAAVRRLAETYTNDFYGYDMETAMRVARIDLESEARAVETEAVLDNNNQIAKQREINALADALFNAGRAGDRTEMAKQIVEAQIARNNRLPWCLAAKQKKLQEAAQNVMREFGVGSTDAYIYAMNILAEDRNYVDTTLRNLERDFYHNTPYHISRGNWYGAVHKFYDQPGEADKSEALLGHYAHARLKQIQLATRKPCLNLTNLVRDPQINTWFNPIPKDLKIHSWQELKASFQGLATAIGNQDTVILYGIGEERLAVLQWVDHLQSFSELNPDLPARLTCVSNKLQELNQNRTDSNRKLLDLCFATIRDYSDSCRDASLTGLEVVEINLAACISKSKEETIFSVAISKYKRNIIQAVAAELTPEGNVEALSAELYLKIFCNKVFNLGFRSEAINSGGCTDETRPTLTVLMKRVFESFDLGCLIDYCLTDDISSQYIRKKAAETEAYQMILIEGETLGESVYLEKLAECHINEAVKILSNLGYVSPNPYYPIMID
jgi:hypothetical protein